MRILRVRTLQRAEDVVAGVNRRTKGVGRGRANLVVDIVGQQLHRERDDVVLSRPTFPFLAPIARQGMHRPPPHSSVFVRDVGEKVWDRHCVEVVVEDDAAPNPDGGICVRESSLKRPRCLGPAAHQLALCGLRPMFDTEVL